MPGKVVDASVLGAVLFGEPRANEARLLLADVDLYEPALLGYELASIARKKIVMYPDQKGTILQVLQEALNIEIFWAEVHHLEVVDLALETGLSTYDASYLYLARYLDMPLVTFDKQLGSFATS
jgi:predicted nucleic acid-binding protein